MNRSTIAGVALALSFALAGCGGSSSSKKSPRSVLEFGLASSSISESGTQIAIAVTRTVTASGDISVSYATSDGTATAGVDYAAASGTLSWLSGDMTDKTFTVDITDDFAVEGDETVNLTISLAVGNATLGLLATAIVTILDDDVPGTLQFSASTFQVDENDLAGTATITVTRAGGVGDAVSVMYATANGTAVEPGDYTATSGTLNWTAGDGAAKTFTIDIVDDAVVEPDETLDITLMNPTGGAALGAPSAATLTIVDDDVTLQFTSATFSENEGSGMQALILVSRLGSVANAVQVGFATMNNTAVAPVDYITTSGSLLWTAGDSADKSFLVTINDDFIVETDEIVDLSLSSPTGGATLGTPNTATLTILNDDMPGSLRLSSATYQVDEDAGSIQITVNRVGGVGDAVSVQYDTADAGATAGADYTTASGTLMWNAGDGTDKTFDILITDDPNPETSEDVDITLSNPMGGAGLSLPTTAVLTIIDDDQPGMIQFTAANFQVNEFTAQATITVSRVGGDLGVVGVSFDTVDSTALAGTDYITASGILMWSDQDSADKQFTVDIINDFDIEGDEDLDLVLSAPTGGASLGTPSGGTLTIIDNDAPGILVLRAFSYQVNENGGMINIRVGRTNGLSGIVTVDYDTADAGATAGQDYTATSGTLMWNDIDGSDKSFDIPILDNPGVEPNEDVTITISNPTGGASTGFPSTATLTIIDDDVTLQLGSTSYLTDEGVGMITIDVTRLGDTTNPVTVDFATMDGSAVAPDDYTMTAGTLMWGASDSAPKTFDVVIIDDTMIETNETLTLSLDSPTGGATLGTPFASGLTITDNDVPGPGSIEFSSATYTAGAYADPVDIIVSRVGGSAGAVSVDYDTTDGTAMAGSDYTAAAGTLMWTDGDSADKMFQVVIIHDVLAESTEQLNLALTNPMGGATLGSPSTATLDIVEGWVKWPGNPVLTASPPTAWDDRNVGQPNVLGPASGFPTYMMWHWGEDQANTPGIGYATSPDGVNWVKLGAPVLTQGAVGDFDEDYLDGPCVVYDAPNGRFIMYYNGDNTAGVTEIGMATSADGISWTKFGLNPILGVGLPGDWDAGAVAFPCVVQDGPTWKMWYTGVDVFGPGSVIQIGYATSLDSATWTKHAGNPVMSPTGGSFDDPGVALPRVIEDGSPTFWMLYTGGVSINPVTFEKIGFALSIDGGITWSKYGDALGMPLPVLDVGPSGAWDDLLIFASAWETIAPSKMWYEGEQASTSNIAIGYATHP